MVAHLLYSIQQSSSYCLKDGSCSINFLPSKNYKNNVFPDNQEDIQALFIKLLRRAGWRVIPDKWEKGLLKVNIAALL